MSFRRSLFYPLYPLYPGSFFFLEKLFSQDKGDEGDKKPTPSPVSRPTLTAALAFGGTLPSTPLPEPASTGRAVEDLFRELDTRLAQGDPDAEHTWRELSQALPGSEFEGPLKAMGEALDGFDFKMATEALARLRKAKTEKQ